MASELYNTIDALSREKGIDPRIVVSAVEDAIVVATRKYYKTQENLRAQLDKDTGKIRAFAVKTIVETPEQVEDPTLQVTVDDARKADPRVAHNPCRCPPACCEPCPWCDNPRHWCRHADHSEKRLPRDSWQFVGRDLCSFFEGCRVRRAARPCNE